MGSYRTQAEKYFKFVHLIILEFQSYKVNY